jgi:hypothetical protein
LQNRIEYQGQARSSDAYGCNYLSELRRVLFQYGRPQTRNYLEWGAGNTTLAIATMRHQLGLERLDTIDDNADYLAAIREQVPPWPGFEAHAADLIGPKLSDRDPELNYATLPLSWGRQFDFIYIDGRRRMECAMVASLIGIRGRLSYCTTTAGLAINRLGCCSISSRTGHNSGSCARLTLCSRGQKHRTLRPTLRSIAGRGPRPLSCAAEGQTCPTLAYFG